MCIVPPVLQYCGARERCLLLLVQQSFSRRIILDWEEDGALSVDTRVSNESLNSKTPTDLNLVTIVLGLFGT